MAGVVFGVVPLLVGAGLNAVLTEYVFPSTTYLVPTWTISSFLMAGIAGVYYQWFFQPRKNSEAIADLPLKAFCSGWILAPAFILLIRVELWIGKLVLTDVPHKILEMF